MISSLRNNTKLSKNILLAILILGCIVRIKVYLENRSLIIDEANLARNIVEKDYVDFLQPLDYEQYSPPLFSALNKFLIGTFGVHEYAFKITSLLAGCVSLFLLFLLSARISQNNPSRLYILFVFAFSILAIRYSSELKQYALDAALCLAFTLWADHWKNKVIGPKEALLLTLTGGLAIWISMPIIFILTAIGFMLLYKSWQRDKREIPYLVLVGTIWLTSFGYYYTSILQTDAQSEYLNNYHKSYFINLLTLNTGELMNSVNLTVGLFRTTIEQTFMSITWGIICFIVGSTYLIKKKKTWALLLLLPILFCLIASQLQLYSLLPRLILFLIPYLLLIIGMGVSQIWNYANRYGKIFIAVVLIMSSANVLGYKYFWQKLEIEDSKSVLNYLKENRLEEELLFVEHDGTPAFRFYNDLYANRYNFENYYLAHWSEEPETVLSKQLKPQDKFFWVFFSHTFPQAHIDENLNSAKKHGAIIEQYISTEASAYKFEILK